MIRFLALCLLSFTLVTGPVMAEALTADQQQAVEQVVRDLLLKKEPELVIKASQKAEDRRRIAVLNKNKDYLYKTAGDGVLGNPQGDVTIVEFFDYHCGYCKKVNPVLLRALEKDHDLRVVTKHLPILSDESIYAARAATAAVTQGQEKFAAFHNALLADVGDLNEERVMAIAKDAKLDVDQLKKDMAGVKEESFKQAYVFATDLVQRVGTPLFVIGNEIFSGDLTDETLAKAVKDVRASAKKPATNH